MISHEEAERLRGSNDESDQLIARQIDTRLATGASREGSLNKLLVLSGPDDAKTVKLPVPIVNSKRSKDGGNAAWTYGQPRYARADLLVRTPAIQTTDELDALG